MAASIAGRRNRINEVLPLTQVRKSCDLVQRLHAMCGLAEEEVSAIAEHEHIPEIAAAALAQYLLGQDHGIEKIRDMLRDDIRHALARNDRDHARDLFMALRHFLSTHPDAAQTLEGGEQFVRAEVGEDAAASENKTCQPPASLQPSSRCVCLIVR